MAASTSPGESPGVTSRAPAPNLGSSVALRALLLGLGCGCVYLLIVGGFRFHFKQTNYPHHVLMADALLHGQFHIRPEALRQKGEQLAAAVAAELDELSRATGRTLAPSARAALIEQRTANRLFSDWAIVDDQVYGYWAPLAPALMMPFVAVFGLGVSDQLINVLFGALNVGLFYWLLRGVDRAGLLRTEEACRLGLTLLLAFGTAHFWLTCTAQVWFAVQIVTLTALLAALLAASTPRIGTWHWLLSGIFFGAALLGRNIVVVLGLFFVLLMWQRSAGGARRGLRFASWMACFWLPVVVAIGLQALYNQARFGSPFDSGLTLQVATGGLQRFQEAYAAHGVFSVHNVPHNLWYYFVNWNLPRLGDGRLWFDLEGNSAFLVTPPLLYAFLAGRSRSRFTLALLGGVVPLVVVLMLYFATGYVQFGPRYLLDGMPLVLLLVAAGMRGRLTHVGYVLIVLAIAAHLFGTCRLCDEEFAVLRGRITSLTLPGLVAVALLARCLLVWRGGGRARGRAAGA